MSLRYSNEGKVTDITERQEKLDYAGPSTHSKASGFYFILFIYYFFFFVFLPFLGPLPRHMEIPRLGVESEL